AGTRDFPDHANVLRLTIGESVDATQAITRETVSVLEANLDDLNPQVFGYVMDKLLEAGALDVFGTPVQMKKNRPGMLLTVLTGTKDAQRIARIIFAETTTLGIRMREERREVLIRRSEIVRTPWGEVRMKIGNLNGTVTNYAPEYEDCRRIASVHGVPLKSVMQEAIRIYLDQQNG
ncbi:MAG TPA: LarC family nickel insertion protein, partial [Terriglobales bacterium]|nr:LarC family nickel insertion protein [Terriglobales bacterium]